MASDHVQKYLDRIEAQHRQRRRFMTHCETLLEMIDGAYETIKGTPSKFNLDDATGEQLSVIGNRVGIPRDEAEKIVKEYGAVDELDDELYRSMILARIFINHWDGTTETFEEILQNTVGQIMDISYYDHHDMTADITINGNIPYYSLMMLHDGILFPRPMGVQYKVKENLLEIKRLYQKYIGTALYCSSLIGFTTDLPDMTGISPEDFLADENGYYLLDEFGTVITDDRNVEEVEA